LVGRWSGKHVLKPAPGRRFFVDLGFFSEGARREKGQTREGDRASESRMLEKFPSLKIEFSIRNIAVSEIAVFFDDHDFIRFWAPKGRLG